MSNFSNKSFYFFIHMLCLEGLSWFSFLQVLKPLDVKTKFYPEVCDLYYLFLTAYLLYKQVYGTTM